MNTDQTQTAKISINGIKEVTAKDIEAPSQLEIMNKNEHIAFLTTKESKLNIEFTIEKGLGYVSREELKKDKGKHMGQSFWMRFSLRLKK